MSAATIKPQASQAAQPGLSHAASSAKWQDSLFHAVTFSFALLVLVILSGIVLSLIAGAWPAFEHFGPGFITRIEWDPVNDEYGALIAIAGTLITSFLALLIAVPVSFGIALFLSLIHI